MWTFTLCSKWPWQPGHMRERCWQQGCRDVWCWSCSFWPTCQMWCLVQVWAACKGQPHTKSSIDSKPSVSEFVHYCYDCIHEEPLVGDIDACEVFSGCGSVTAALKAIWSVGDAFQLVLCKWCLYVSPMFLRSSVMQLLSQTLSMGNALMSQQQPVFWHLAEYLSLCSMMNFGLLPHHTFMAALYLTYFRACLVIVRRVRRRGLAFFAPLCLLDCKSETKYCTVTCF